MSKLREAEDLLAELTRAEKAQLLQSAVRDLGVCAGQTRRAARAASSCCFVEEDAEVREVRCSP